MCHFDPVVSLSIESTIKLLSGYEMFSSCFWCHSEYKIVLYHYVIITSERFINCASNSLET